MAAALQMIQNPEAAAVLLHPSRLRLLELLREPDSASGLARKLELPRQKVNYHLRELEHEGLVEFVEERKKGNCVERVVRAAARYYLLNPAVLGKVGADPREIADRFSAAYLIATSARAIREVASMAERAKKQNKRIATLTLGVDVRFRSAADRQAFARELATAVAHLAARYHDAKAEAGRAFRLFAGVYPAPPATLESTAGNLTLE